MSWKKNLTTMILSLWLISGVFIDGYHHETEELDSFFTPWHAILYTGFLATAIWMVYLVLQNRKISRKSFRESIPNGYGLGILGVAVFLMGGIADMIWHMFLGIEKDIAALLSPSHLTLLTGALLIVSSPLRMSWRESKSAAPSFLEILPALLSVSLTVSMMAFFFMYAWALKEGIPSNEWYTWYEKSFTATSPHGNDHLFKDLEKRGIVNILLTVSVMFYPIYFLMKRWKLPFGSVMFLLTLPNLFVSLLNGFRNFEIVFLCLLTGLFGDMILKNGNRQKLFSIVMPMIFWGIYFIGVSLLVGMWWSPEIWGGAIVLSAITSYFLYILSVPHNHESTSHIDSI